jgi:hypothetical protein
MAMNIRTSTWPAAAVLMTAMGLLTCSPGPPAITPPPPVSSAPVWTVPGDVKRIAVFYPRPVNPDFSEAYQRLEAAVFRLKGQRPSLRVIDRFNLPILRKEQHFQHTGSVMEEGAVRIGRLLGVDSVLLFSIDGPTIRDRIMASRPGHLRPITVTAKIVRVETAEVVYHNVVTARMDESKRGRWSFTDSADFQQLGREALDRGVRQAVFDLQRAFE